jgi:integrase
LSDLQRLGALRRRMQRYNHPAKGSAIKVEPIRDINVIKTIKTNLRYQPRNLCLFTLGINTAYRAGELLSLRISDVADLRVGDSLEIKQSKTNAYRRATLNRSAYESLQRWINVHPKPSPSSPLFLSRHGGAISVSYVSQLVKHWCKEAGLKGNYASHTLRKTWGYHQRMSNQSEGVVPLLMRAFGHSSEAQTLEYLCIQPKEIKDLYLQMEL